MKFLFLFSFSLLLFTGCGESEKDNPCVDVNCGTNGTCNLETGSCDCKLFFEGNECELLSRAKFLGSYAGTSVCTLNPSNVVDFSIAITEETRIGAVLLQSPQLFQGFRMTGIMDESNNVNIAKFKPFAGSNEFDGKVISIDSSNIEMTLNAYANDMLSNTCVYTLSK